MEFAHNLAFFAAGLAVGAGSFALGQRDGVRRGGRVHHGCALDRRWAHGAPPSALPRYLPEVRTGPLF